MKQLNLLDCSEPVSTVEETATEWKLYIDGASRSNPGQAGAGIYLLKNDKPEYKEGFYLGIKTNNQAEYLALLLGIFSCKRLMFPDDILYIISDSELLVRQMKGEYKVKRDTLKSLNKTAFAMLAGINYSLCHVLREYNTQADKLANKGIDDGNPMPSEFITMLQNNGITF
jgi:ribonuclease HI